MRTTEAAVRLILQTSLTSSELLRFIEDASLWITEDLVPAGGGTVSDARLEIIERYLACALVRTRDVMRRSISFYDVSETFQSDDQVTDYLLRAAAMDPTGTIRKMFLAPKDRRVASAVIGKGYRGDVAEES